MQQTIEHPTLGTLYLTKRRRQKHIRISIGHEGRVAISLPTWLPYKAGIVFAESRRDWIAKQREMHSEKYTLLEDGAAIGKTYTLVFEGIETGKLRTRLAADTIRVYIPDIYRYQDEAVQAAARRACERALQRESELLLPNRVREMAARHGYKFKSITCKKLKRRWGSCDSAKNLVFNTHLMLLPWELIDYVVLHELNHTVHMHHQAAFWDNLSTRLPTYKELRKELRSHQPSIMLTV